MAVFDESKVITPLHPEKAEVGKKYWYADSLIPLKKHVEDNNTEFIGKLNQIDTDAVCIFEIHNSYAWEFLYPYEEPPKQRMTRRQLSEWLAKGNGQVGYNQLDISHVNTYLQYSDRVSNEEVEEFYRIRSWDSEEWIEPTVDIYERDCKGGKE